MKFTNASTDSTLAPSWFRAGIVTVGGLGCGWLSGTVVSQSTEMPGALIKWAPGVIFAIATLIAAWIPGGIAARARIRNSMVGNLGLLGGITMAYTAAYFAAYFVVLKIDKYLPDSVDLFIGGIAGGAIGATVLVNIWAMLFPCLAKPTAMTAMIIWGTLLGVTLSLSSPDCSSDTWKPSLWLYVLWQGGMALGLAIIDRNWRTEFRARTSTESLSM
jgi:hypothetical protein